MPWEFDSGLPVPRPGACARPSRCDPELVVQLSQPCAIRRVFAKRILADADRRRLKVISATGIQANSESGRGSARELHRRMSMNFKVVLMEPHAIRPIESPGIAREVRSNSKTGGILAVDPYAPIGIDEHRSNPARVHGTPEGGLGGEPDLDHRGACRRDAPTAAQRSARGRRRHSIPGVPLAGRSIEEELVP